MADPIQGKNFILSMLVGSDYKPMLCAEDCTLTCGVEMVERTGPTSAGARERMRRLEDWTSTATGITRILNADSLSWFYLLQVAVRRVEQTFRATWSDEEGNMFMLTGPGVFGSQSINGPASELCHATVEIFWNGAPVQTVIEAGSESGESGGGGDVLPGAEPQLQTPLALAGAAGDTSVTDSALSAVGVTIILVFREGYQYDPVSGSPGNREFQFTGGSIVFAIPFASGGEEVTVIYKV